MKKLFIIFIIFSLHTFCMTIKLGVPEPVFNLSNFRILGDLLVKSFKEINYDVEFVPLPYLRALDMVEKNEIDGAFPFDLSTIKTYKNTFAVNEKIGGLDLYAYTMEGDPQVKSWSDLKDKKVGYFLGSVLIETKVNEIVTEKENITTTKDYKALLKLLENARVDVIIMDSKVLDSIKTKQTKVNGNSIYSNPVYLFLNNKHSKIKGNLENELKKYKANSDINF